MSTLPIQHERRGAQRFEFHLPVSIRLADSDHEEPGCTQDLSARGAFFFTDFAVSEGANIELTLIMPSEITLTEKMRVRCRGRVLRIVRPAQGTRIGVAVHLKGYEFLPEVQDKADEEGNFARISALHEHHLPDKEGRTTTSRVSRAVVINDPWR
ncbi:MAG TPA: PilZ domain-containing protein [Terriglobales bacterium]|nr:PilZ domain-containing protein [Terriglobales bacterium]